MVASSFTLESNHAASRDFWDDSSTTLHRRPLTALCPSPREQLLRRATASGFGLAANRRGALTPLVSTPEPACSSASSSRQGVRGIGLVSPVAWDDELDDRWCPSPWSMHTSPDALTPTCVPLPSKKPRRVLSPPDVSDGEPAWLEVSGDDAEFSGTHIEFSDVLETWVLVGTPVRSNVNAVCLREHLDSPISDSARTRCPSTPLKTPLASSARGSLVRGQLKGMWKGGETDAALHGITVQGTQMKQPFQLTHDEFFDALAKMEERRSRTESVSPDAVGELLAVASTTGGGAHGLVDVVSHESNEGKCNGPEESQRANPEVDATEAGETGDVCTPLATMFHSEGSDQVDADGQATFARISFGHSPERIPSFDTHNDSRDSCRPEGTRAGASLISSSLDSSHFGTMKLPRELRHMLSVIIPRTPRYAPTNGLTSRPSKHHRGISEPVQKQAVTHENAEVQAAEKEDAQQASTQSACQCSPMDIVYASQQPKRTMMVHRCDPNHINVSKWTRLQEPDNISEERKLQYFARIRTQFPGALESGSALAKASPRKYSRRSRYCAAANQKR